jgi:hypothetical protein
MRVPGVRAPETLFVQPIVQRVKTNELPELIRQVRAPCSPLLYIIPLHPTP